MSNVQVGIFTLVDPAPDEEACFRFALDQLRPDVRDALPRLMRPHRVEITEAIPGTKAVPKPEGLYPGGRLIMARPLRRKGKLLVKRVAGTLIHEMFHGTRRSRSQRKAMRGLFDNAPWDGPYWDCVGEAAAYWWTRVATDGRLVSRYEDDTLELDESEFDDLLAIQLGAPVEDPDEALPADPTPGPDPVIVQLTEERDELARLLTTCNESAGLNAQTIRTLEARIAAKDQKMQEGLSL